MDPMSFKLPPPAPQITRSGLCSDCAVQAVWAADGDMRVCPKCYALLWRKDYSAEIRQKKLAAMEIARQREAERRAQKAAMKAAAKAGSHQIVAAPLEKPPTSESPPDDQPS